MESYEKLILGDAPDIILEASEALLPTINEGLFVRDVIDILTDPFGVEKLKLYSTYVGELTKPLVVYSDNAPHEVLFTVPALVQSPVTTIPSDNGFNTEVFLNSLTRDIDLGGKHVNNKIQTFLLSITKTPNYYTSVIQPIQSILKRYGREMISLPGVENKETPQPIKEIKVQNESSKSSFSDEYDD